MATLEIQPCAVRKIEQLAKNLRDLKRLILFRLLPEIAEDGAQISQIFSQLITYLLMRAQQLRSLQEPRLSNNSMRANFFSRIANA